MKRLTLGVVVFILLLAQHANAQSKWYLILYGGQITDGTLGETLCGAVGLENSYFTTLAVARELKRFDDWVSVEVEGQVVQHFGIQDHEEFNLALVVRWLPFPWDCYLDTSFALGDGLSYATDIPEIESERHDEVSTRFLNYLMFEFDFKLPQFPRWSLIARLHHRSGIYGLFDGVDGASNAVCLGVKYNL